MRTSKAVAVLDKHEAALKTERDLLHTKLNGVEQALERIKQMRSDMQALPKRSSKVKNRVPVVGNTLASAGAAANAA